MSHRGRLQAQGHDILVNTGTVSHPWSRDEAFPVLDGHLGLASIKEALTPTQREARDYGFRAAAVWMDRVHRSGGIGPTSKTFRAQARPADIRVDIEVKTGRAFV